MGQSSPGRLQKYVKEKEMDPSEAHIDPAITSVTRKNTLTTVTETWTVKPR